MVVGISNNQGKIAEEFFSLIHFKKNPCSQASVLISLIRSSLRPHDKIGEEYDLILHNSDSVFIIEVKY